MDGKYVFLSKQEKLEEDKNGLIDLIKWYRDEWHRVDGSHSEMIENVKKVQDEKELSFYEKIVDGWLDY